MSNLNAIPYCFFSTFLKTPHFPPLYFFRCNMHMTISVVIMHMTVFVVAVYVRVLTNNFLLPL